MIRAVVAVLVAISVTGLVGIPLGDPDFLPEAIALELSYVALTVLSIKKIRYVFIPNFVLATLVIAGNTFSSTHVSVMLALNPLHNAIILIIGGYALQALLIITSVLAYRSLKKAAIKR
ncbi:MAG: hypothetical protein ACE5J2_03815 [Nitrososphaerales archaeon]